MRLPKRKGLSQSSGLKCGWPKILKARTILPKIGDATKSFSSPKMKSATRISSRLFPSLSLMVSTTKLARIKNSSRNTTRVLSPYLVRFRVKYQLKCSTATMSEPNKSPSSIRKYLVRTIFISKSNRTSTTKTSWSPTKD